MPPWWASEAVRGELQQALGHINWSVRYADDEVHRCRLLFDALNVLWAAHDRMRGELGRSDSAAFCDLLLEGVTPDGKHALCTNRAVGELARLQPPVLDHDVLRRASAYAAGQPLPSGIERSAADKHGQLSRAYERLERDAGESNKIALLKKLAQLLYVVRSNIAHGEKLFRPRDREVSALADSALDAVVEALFDNPVGYVNPSSCCSGVFVDESAESVAPVDLAGWLRAGEA